MDRTMKTKLFFLVIIITVALANAQTTTIFFDDFNGTIMSKDLWHIPTWVSPTDGTYLGRTQFRCAQNAGLPEVSNSQAVINVETYNPTGFSFYGTDLITNKTFSMGNGLIFTIRAKIKAPVAGGIVGGIFLYDLVGSGTTHDEIDYELLTNKPNEVQTNIYNNEPLGAGHPLFESITGSITDYHTYVIRWLPNEVTWMIDGNIIRTNKTLIPDKPMHFHLNIWAPDEAWSVAYESNLQPTNSIDLNQIYSMIVDSVKVDSLVFPNSVSEINEKEVKINFYPDPAHDFIYFTTPGKMSISIYNVNGGMILYKKEITDGSLSIEGLPPGIYVVRIGQNRNVRNAKLIKY
jgi:hypothetical protein